MFVFHHEKPNHLVVVCLDKMCEQFDRTIVYVRYTSNLGLVWFFIVARIFQEFTYIRRILMNEQRNQLEYRFF